MGASTNCDDDHSDYDDDQYHGFFSKVIYGDVYMIVMMINVIE